VTILLTELPDNYEASIRTQLLERFGIANPKFHIRMIHQLPHSDLGYEIFQLPTPIVTDYWGIKDSSVIRIEDCSDVSTIAEIIAPSTSNQLSTFVTNSM
jgi:hypothetical protein